MMQFPYQDNQRLDVKVEGNQLIFYNPSQPIKDRVSLSFHRTLRIPEDGKVYPLPPSLGSFPIKRVDDYLNKVPKEWIPKGGVFIPLFQREALWIQFNNTSTEYPHALKVATGKVNALSGEGWDEEIKKRNVQDYCVTPLQPWLDGINSGNGVIKQFVAMRLGEGYTVEGQVTGEEKVGGVQIVCYRPKETQRVNKFQPKKNITIKKKTTNNTFYNKWNYSEPTTNAPPPNPWAVPPTAFNNPQFIIPQQQPVLSTYNQYSSCSAPMVDDLFGGYSTTMNSTTAASLPHKSSSSKQSVDLFCFDQCENYSNSNNFNNNSADSFDFFCDTSSYNNNNRRSSNNNMNQTTSVYDAPKELGIAAGGKIKQQIVEDPYGPEFWDLNSKSRVFVHIVNSEMYRLITGENPPETPISAKTYSSYGYPWFDWYNENVKSVQKSTILEQVKSVSQVDQQKYAWPIQDNSTCNINNVKVIKSNYNPYSKNSVRDGDW
ncbi:hypothetical protein ABK040_002068 [Willaertia magna]